MKGIADFVYVDGPHSAAGAFEKEEMDAGGDCGPPLGWWVAGENAETAGAGAASGWVRPSLSRQAVGVQESLESLRSAAATLGPFDVVFGFSQGAAMAALLMATTPGLARSAVLVSGFIPSDPVWADRMTAAPVAAAVLIVGGESDKLVTLDRVDALAACFPGAEIFRHDGGHGVPSNAAFRSVLKEFLLKQQQEVHSSSRRAERERG